MSSEIDFPEMESYPPTVVDARGSYDIASHLKWNLRGNQPLTLEVVVRDPNVEERLFARWLVSDRSNNRRLLSICNENTGEDAAELPAVNRTVERPFSFTIEPSDFSAEGCYRLDLAVSGSFKLNCTELRAGQGFSFSVTDPPNDYGEATWWLQVFDGSPGTASFECPAQEVSRDETAAPL